MDGKTHRKIGTAAGALVGITAASDADDIWQKFLALIGGAIGGNLGARMPDWIEPAVHSHHRNIAHSVTAGTSIVAYAAKKTRAWERQCRERAAYFAERLENPHLDFFDRIKYGLAELFWRIAVGFARGLGAGYLSHLALDARTPRGIPLLVRGF